VLNKQGAGGKLTRTRYSQEAFYIVIFFEIKSVVLICVEIDILRRNIGQGVEEREEQCFCKCRVPAE